RNLAKYSLWQFRDFVLERGIAIVLIGCLWSYVTFEPMRRAMGAQWRGDQTSPVWAIALQVSAALVSLSVLIAMNGIVSTNRKSGYYRFLFSKPISPVVYYAQLFVVYMAGVLVGCRGIGGGGEGGRGEGGEEQVRRGKRHHRLRHLKRLPIIAAMTDLNPQRKLTLPPSRILPPPPASRL